MMLCPAAIDSETPPTPKLWVSPADTAKLTRALATAAGARLTSWSVGGVIRGARYRPAVRGASRFTSADLGGPAAAAMVAATPSVTACTPLNVRLVATLLAISAGERPASTPAPRVSAIDPTPANARRNRCIVVGALSDM